MIDTHSGIKIISYVLFAPEIYQNFLSSCQLIEKGYSLIFKNKACMIVNSCDQELVTVAMADRCFILDIN